MCSCKQLWNPQVGFFSAFQTHLEKNETKQTKKQTKKNKYTTKLIRRTWRSFPADKVHVVFRRDSHKKMKNSSQADVPPAACQTCVSSPWGKQDKWSGPLGHRVHLYALKWFVAARRRKRKKKKQLKNKCRVFTAQAGTSQRCREGEQDWNWRGGVGGHQQAQTGAASAHSYKPSAQHRRRKKKKYQKDGRQGDLTVHHHLPDQKNPPK